MIRDFTVNLKNFEKQFNAYGTAVESQSNRSCNRRPLKEFRLDLCTDLGTSAVGKTV